MLFALILAPFRFLAMPINSSGNPREDINSIGKLFEESTNLLAADREYLGQCLERYTGVVTFINTEVNNDQQDLMALREYWYGSILYIAHQPMVEISSQNRYQLIKSLSTRKQSIRSVCRSNFTRNIKDFERANRYFVKIINMEHFEDAILVEKE